MAFNQRTFTRNQRISFCLWFEFHSGRWISGIQLTKGGSTVVNGYESITGQINTEFVKFNKNQKIL